MQSVSKSCPPNSCFSIDIGVHAGTTQTTEPTYMLTLIDRGASFFGHISFVSVIARKLR